MEENNFGKFLAELRKEKGFTQLQLADLVHVTDKTISRWENNGGYPDIDTMHKLCDIFDVTMDDLYAAKKVSKYLNKRRKRIKATIIGLISILLIGCIIFGAYFIINYNSVKFYTLSIKNGDFNLRGAYYLDANKKNLLQISKIEYLGNEEIEDVYIEIYEKDGLTIYSGLTKDDIFIETIDNINVEDLYMKVTYTLNGEKVVDELKIENVDRFKNNDFVKLKAIREAEEADESISDNIIESMKELGYELYSNTVYIKIEKTKKYEMKKYYDVKSKKYNEVYAFNNGKLFEIEYLFKKNNIYFQLKDKNNVIIEEFNYSITSKKVNCLSNRCSKWDEVIKDTEEEIISLEEMIK